MRQGRGCGQAAPATGWGGGRPAERADPGAMAAHSARRRDPCIGQMGGLRASQRWHRERSGAPAPSLPAPRLLPPCLEAVCLQAALRLHPHSQHQDPAQQQAALLLAAGREGQGRRGGRLGGRQDTPAVVSSPRSPRHQGAGAVPSRDHAASGTRLYCPRGTVLTSSGTCAPQSPPLLCKTGSAVPPARWAAAQAGVGNEVGEAVQQVVQEAAWNADMHHREPARHPRRSRAAQPL